MTLGFLSSPESLGANPELTWKHPASEWAACREGGGITHGVVLECGWEMGADCVLELLVALSTYTWQDTRPV